MQQIVPNLWINDGKIEEAVDVLLLAVREQPVTGSNRLRTRRR